MAIKVESRYAKDSGGRLISIADVDKTKGKDTYTCPGCGDEMVACQGEKKAWYFRHKNDECSDETYLHSLAKTKIYEWLRDAEKVDLIIDQWSTCKEYDECFFRNEVECKRSQPNPYNLKDYYNLCTLEERVQVGDKYFVPDILLRSTEGNSLPLWIEINVTHACEEEKIHTGVQIIEFKVENEDDIAKIILEPIKRREGVVYYNFSEEAKERTERFQRKLAQLKLPKFGQTQYLDSSCLKLDVRAPNAIANLLYPQQLSPSLDCKEAVSILRCISDRCCGLCKHRMKLSALDTCCRMYGHIVNKDEAERCEDYEVNMSLLNGHVGALKSLCKSKGIKLWINDEWYRSLSD